MENLIKALVKAREGFESIDKDKINPHFKNKYATLDSINKAVMSSLCKNELVITQTVEQSESGQSLKTTLWHSSGEKIESSMSLPNISDMQKLGSAITYARRYSLSAILGVSADEDDDGNGVSGGTLTKKESTKKAAPKSSKPGCISEGQQKRMFAIASEYSVSMDDLKAICGRHGFTSRADVTVAKYKQIISEIQSFNQGEKAA